MRKSLAHSQGAMRKSLAHSHFVFFKQKAGIINKNGIEPLVRHVHYDDIEPLKHFQLKLGKNQEQKMRGWEVKKTHNSISIEFRAICFQSYVLCP